MTAFVRPGPVVRGLAEPLAITSDVDGLLAIVVLFVAGLATVYDGFHKWQQYRLMQDTPREKVRSAAAGRTEVQGTARAAYGTVPRPFADGDCLLAEWEVEEYRADDDGGHWHTVASGRLSTPFVVGDGTGNMRVEPDEDATLEFSEENELEIEVDGDDVTPNHIAAFLRRHTSVDVQRREGLDGMLFDQHRRYSHAVLPVDSPVYVLGSATPMQRDDPASSNLVLRRDEAEDEFIIADHSETELVSHYKWRAPAQVVGGLALSAAMLYLLLV